MSLNRLVDINTNNTSTEQVANVRQDNLIDNLDNYHDAFFHTQTFQNIAQNIIAEANSDNNTDDNDDEVSPYEKTSFACLQLCHNFQN